MIVGICILLGSSSENDFKYFLPPRDAIKRSKGNAKAIIVIGNNQAFVERKSVVFTRLKIESRSIMANTVNAAPKCEQIISIKKFAIFLSKVKHLTFCNYHFKGNIVLVGWKGVENK